MSLQDRIARKVFVTDTGCWNWTGYVCPKQGYGFFSVNNKNTRVSRAAYIAFKGDIPAGLCVCHSCDNRLCVNPEHLFLGTVAENINDCVLKGRNARGARQRKAVFTEDQIREIRANAGIIRNVDAAQKYGVTAPAIWSVINRRTWRHV